MIFRGTTVLVILRPVVLLFFVFLYCKKLLESLFGRLVTTTLFASTLFGVARSGIVASFLFLVLS